MVLHLEGGRDRRQGPRVGPVGGRIVAEVLVGLLQKDLNSYLYLQPTWKPAPPIAPARGQFTMADLLTYARDGPDEPGEGTLQRGSDEQSRSIGTSHPADD